LLQDIREIAIPLSPPPQAATHLWLVTGGRRRCDRCPSHPATTAPTPPFRWMLHAWRCHPSVFL